MKEIKKLIKKITSALLMHILFICLLKELNKHISAKRENCRNFLESVFFEQNTRLCILGSKKARLKRTNKKRSKHDVLLLLVSFSLRIANSRLVTLCSIFTQFSILLYSLVSCFTNAYFEGFTDSEPFMFLQINK